MSLSPVPSPVFEPVVDGQDDNRLNAFNPFTMVFVGVAYVIIFVYVLRFALALVRNLIHRGRFGRWANTDEAGTEVESIRSESLPSFYKVVVLPDKDVCYGVANESKQDSDEKDTLKYSQKQLLRFQLLGQLENISESNNSENNYHHHRNNHEDTDNENDMPIRFFRTASISLEPDFDTQNEIDEFQTDKIDDINNENNVKNQQNLQNSLKNDKIDQNNNEKNLKNQQKVQNTEDDDQEDVFVDVPDEEENPVESSSVQYDKNQERKNENSDDFTSKNQNIKN